MNNAPSFPTTQEVDTFSTPVVNLTGPVKIIFRTKQQTLELFLAIREAAPNLSISEFKQAYFVTPATCAFIESRLGLAQ